MPLSIGSMCGEETKVLDTSIVVVVVPYHTENYASQFGVVK